MATSEMRGRFLGTSSRVHFFLLVFIREEAGREEQKDESGSTMGCTPRESREKEKEEKKKTCFGFWTRRARIIITHGHWTRAAAVLGSHGASEPMALTRGLRRPGLEPVPPDQ